VLKHLVTPELSGIDRDALERQWPLLIDQVHQTWASALGGDLTMRYGERADNAKIEGDQPGLVNPA
jgi:hypothetical protein